MSLINTMLKDLELRRRHQGPPRGMLRYEQLSLQAVKPKRQVSAGWWVLLFLTLLLALVALVAGAVAAWVVTQQERTPRDADTPVQAIQQEPALQAPQAPVPVPEAPPPSPAVALPSVPPTASKPSSVEPPATTALAPQPVVNPGANAVAPPEAASAEPARTAPPPRAVAAQPPVPPGAPVANASTPARPPAAAPRPAPALHLQPPWQRRHPQPQCAAMPPASAAGNAGAASRESQDAQADRWYAQALQTNTKQAPARLLLARLLTEGKQQPAAADLLTDGLMLLPRQTAFAREQAPLWMQAGQREDAMALLAQSTRNAGNSDPRLHACCASQLLRLKCPAEAETHYRAALLGEAQQGEWLVGLSLSLQPLGRQPEAMEAFRCASGGGRLSPPVKAMVDQILTKLQAQTP
jgi:Tfp pilus assembly protein PilF